MSEYLILIYDNEKVAANASEADFGQIMAGHMKFGEKNGSIMRGGNALQSTDTATSIRPDGAGFAVTDGPFTETKEALSGYYLIEAADLDAAIALAKEIPVYSGGLEVRPVRVFE